MSMRGRPLSTLPIKVINSCTKCKEQIICRLELAHFQLHLLRHLSLVEFQPVLPVQDIHHRHRNVVPTMAMGIAALKRDLPSGLSMDRLYDVHEFLDSFYMSRIGIRMLIGQHIELHRPPRENYIGSMEYPVQMHS